MARERMRDLELPAYMRALAEARQLYARESSDRLMDQVENVEWLDKLAEALGISIESEDWWDAVVPAKREKILGRISLLRDLRCSSRSSTPKFSVGQHVRFKKFADTVVIREVRERQYVIGAGTIAWESELECT